MNSESIISNFLTEKLSPVAIYLFGSFSSGNYNAQSDIDIAVLAKETLDTSELYELSAGISAILNRDIHLIDFKNVSPVLKMQILKKKKVIYCSDDEERIYHEMLALSEYQKLNDERSPVLTKILGANYGHYFK